MGHDHGQTTLGELCDPERGITYGIVKVGDFIPDGVPVIRGGDIRNGKIVFDNEKRVSREVSEQFRRTILRGGEILINLIAEPGHTAIVPSELAGANVSRDVAVIPLNNDVEHRYVNYCLRAPSSIDWLTSRLQGSVTQKINLGILRELPIPARPLSVQRAIASILGALDDKIDLNRRMNDTLEELARTIFKSWFVDFDPVKAKAEGRQPVGMDAQTAALFPSRLVQSELGMIPEGWEVKAVRDVVEGLYDGPHATPPESDSGNVFLGIKNFTPTHLDLSEIRRISDEHWPTWTRRVVPQKGDIVFTYEATLGFFALVPSWLHCCLGRRTALVRPKSINEDGLFIFHQFIASPFQKFLRAHFILGATVDRISLIDFPGYPLLWPKHRLAQSFHRSVEPMWDRIFSNMAESRTLSELRDTLLPKLISGELRVPQAEKLVEASL